MLTKGVLRAGGDTRFLMAGDILFLWVASLPLGMLAGFVHGLCEGLSAPERFKLSIACGAAATQTQGSQSPEKADIYSLLSQVKVRRIL